MNIPVAERADYIRVIMAELSRVQNHLVFIGILLNDLGAMYTPALYAFEERELILDIFEAVSGARMMCNYFRFGGVVRDVPDDVMQKIKDLVFDRLPAKTDEMDRLLSENEVLVSRLKGIHVIDGETAIKYSVTGPVLRAAGVPYDIRRADPYSASMTASSSMWRCARTATCTITISSAWMRSASRCGFCSRLSSRSRRADQLSETAVPGPGPGR